MGQVIDNVYGEALFEAAIDLDSVDEIHEEFKSIIELLKSERKFRVLLETPRIPTREKLVLIDEVIGKSYSKTLTNFVKILTEKRRISYIFDIYDAFKKIYIDYHGIILAKVVSAEKLSDSQLKKLTLKLSELSGKRVETKNIVDESLIGGIRIEADGKVIDGSISSKLINMKDSLKELVLNTNRSI